MIDIEGLSPEINHWSLASYVVTIILTYLVYLTKSYVIALSGKVTTVVAVAIIVAAVFLPLVDEVTDAVLLLLLLLLFININCSSISSRSSSIRSFNSDSSRNTF